MRVVSGEREPRLHARGGLRSRQRRVLVGKHASRCRVLLVDDTPEIRELLRLALEMDGRFEFVGEAGDGRTAVSLTQSEKPHTVILDLAMPVMDGLQAIPEIRKEAPEAKILVLSGFEARQMSKEAMARGADAYVEKGKNLTELMARLAELCPNIPPAA
jgi:DNA-binding NarL/FixJ family response regulator